ncbi:MAG TPA: ATP-dependent DNA helicase RecG [Ignavibacteriaceae bacterium]|nr:ATP-dependent DNA helicase RecG [Ignavibacteriaceae bacterium]
MQMISQKENILDQSVQFLKSVGPKRAEAFRKIGIKTIRDILFYFPSRHLDRTTTLSSAKAFNYILNGYDGELTIIAKVEDKERRRFNRRDIMIVQFRDSAGFFECIWYQGAKYFYDVFNEGDYFAVSGKPLISNHGKLQFAHPDFDRLSEDESKMLNTGKIIPFYRIPKELKETAIGDFSLRKIISYAVENFADKIEETLPDYLLKQNDLVDIVAAVKNFHFPVNRENLEAASKRFKYEELFYLQILIALRKLNYKLRQPGHSFKVKTSLVKDFLSILSFKLTNAQLKALSEIKADMESEFPMNRLLQGDVGSGKTIVALISMLIAVDNGYQAVMMVPTEILADQHAKNISAMMNKLFVVHKKRNVKISLLLGGQKKSVREKNLEAIELKEADIIIGTHALFEENVRFNNLGLVIVDEQHRFGVTQRGRLLGKGITPDVIVMSATPIPRTLSMTLYGDLDVSIINEMPENRRPVKTVLRGENKLPEIFRFIVDKNKKEGYQAFIVYPLVEESEKLELKAAESHYNELRESYLKDLNIGLIHGRMSWQDKETVMFEFLHKKFDVLIATTVIEVGIDIPDANIILINDAHRFGLSQLHQLRGRVGRGTKQAYCILVTKDRYAATTDKLPSDLEYLSPVQKEKYKSGIRLKTMVEYLDGFKIAEVDMKLRGPGDIFGTKQSGIPEFKFINIIEDTGLLISARESAFKIITGDPHLEKDENKIIREILSRHYRPQLEYIKIA